eukprot:COSAG02_NODE_2108_length_9809_cov_4.022966_7_plen_99_part_00
MNSTATASCSRHGLATYTIQHATHTHTHTHTHTRDCRSAARPSDRARIVYTLSVCGGGWGGVGQWLYEYVADEHRKRLPLLLLLLLFFFTWATARLSY